MSFLDKIKDIVSVSEEGYYNDTEDEYMTYRPNEDEEPEQEVAPSRVSRQSRRAQQDAVEDPNKVVNIHTTAQLKVVLTKPEKFEDARGIADHLNDKKTVVLNLEAANREVARRLVDFLSGVAYANHGALKKVANNTFIITPYNVDVMGDLIDELENTGVFF